MGRLLSGLSIEKILKVHSMISEIYFGSGYLKTLPWFNSLWPSATTWPHRSRSTWPWSFHIRQTFVLFYRIDIIMTATVWPSDPEADSDASEACIVNMTPGLSWTTRLANLAYPMSSRSRWYTKQPLSMYQAGGCRRCRARGGYTMASSHTRDNNGYSVRQWYL